MSEAVHQAPQSASPSALASGLLAGARRGAARLGSLLARAPQRLREDEAASKAGFHILSAAQCDDSEEANHLLGLAWMTYGEKAFANALSQRSWSAPVELLLDNARQKAGYKTSLLLSPMEALLWMPDLSWAARLAPMIPERSWRARVATSDSWAWVMHGESLGVRHFPERLSTLSAPLILCMRRREGRASSVDWAWGERFKIFAPKLARPTQDELIVCRALLGKSHSCVEMLNSWVESFEISEACASARPPHAGAPRRRL